MPKTVMLVAGEASGDLHGAEIAERLYAQQPGIQCVGMGSRHMRDAGVKLLTDSANIAVVGLIEVLAHWNDIQAALNCLKKYLVDSPPDLLVLIDYPEFNLKLAASAKKLGIKVLFYVSPQVWAWRPGRIKKIGRLIDMMAVIFPFEKKVYEEAGIPVRYVGHPLTQKVKTSTSREQAYKEFELNPEYKTVALLPGSRRSEIKRILPIIIKSAELIQKHGQNIQFIMPIASALPFDEIQKQVHENSITDIKLVQGRAYDVIQCSDTVVVASGTATLEVALLNKPMVIIYRVSTLSYAIIKRLIKVKNVGLANIVAGKQVVPELIQNLATPENISAEVLRQLNDTDYYNQLLAGLNLTINNLGKEDGIQGITGLIIEILNTTQA